MTLCLHIMKTDATVFAWWISVRLLRLKYRPNHQLVCRQHWIQLFIRAVLKGPILLQPNFKITYFGKILPMPLQRNRILLCFDLFVCLFNKKKLSAPYGCPRWVLPTPASFEKNITKMKMKRPHNKTLLAFWLKTLATGARKRKQISRDTALWEHGYIYLFCSL